MRRALLTIALAAPLFAVSCDERSDSPIAARDASALSSEASERSVSVSVRVRDASITTAARTELTVRTSAPESVSIESPDIARLLTDWTVTPDGPARRDVVGERVVRTRTYRLEPFLPGEYSVPALAFDWSDEQTNESGTLTTEPLAIIVTSVLDEGEQDAEFADIKAVATPEREIDWLVVILIAVGTSAIVAIIASLVIRRLTRELVRPVDRTPAHHAALAQLDALDPATVTGEIGAKRFYADASTIVRTYIEDRFGLHAPDRTTEEFLRECGGSYDFADDDIALLERFLNIADLVKFAKHTADATDADRAIFALRGFIERTGDERRVIVSDRQTGERLRVETVGGDSRSGPGGEA